MTTTKSTCDAGFHARSAALRRDDLDAGRWPVHGGEPCLLCDLPLGLPCDPTPANDTPDALVELRAAELSCSTKGITMAEHDGFGDYDDDLDPPPNDWAWSKPWQAGWLARAIVSHEEVLP